MVKGGGGGEGGEGGGGRDGCTRLLARASSGQNPHPKQSHRVQ